MNVRVFKRNKVGNGVLSAVPVIALLGIQSFISFIGMMLVVALRMPELIRVGDADALMEVATDTNFLMTVMAIYAVIGTIVFGLWYRIFKKDKLEVEPKCTYPSTPESHQISLSLKGYSPLLILSLPILALGMQYLANYILSIVAVFVPGALDSFEELMDGVGLTGDVEISLPLVLAIVILGPICEELCCRGVSFGYAARALPFWGANILQAFFFGAMHLNLIQGSYAFLLGLVLGYIYHKSGNILLPIILHILFNAASTFGSEYFYFGEENPLIFCGILFIVLCVTYGAFWLTMQCIPEKEVKMPEMPESFENDQMNQGM